jgi:hypothetical protein
MTSGKSKGESPYGPAVGVGEAETKVVGLSVKLGSGSSASGTESGDAMGSGLEVEIGEVTDDEETELGGGTSGEGVTVGAGEGTGSASGAAGGSVGAASVVLLAGTPLTGEG